MKEIKWPASTLRQSLSAHASPTIKPIFETSEKSYKQNKNNAIILNLYGIRKQKINFKDEGYFMFELKEMFMVLCEFFG